MTEKEQIELILFHPAYKNSFNRALLWGRIHMENLKITILKEIKWII